MAYKVVSEFFDAKDNFRLYKVGDIYPAEGGRVSKARADELARGLNPYGKVFIEEVKAPSSTSERKVKE